MTTFEGILLLVVLNLLALVTLVYIFKTQLGGSNEWY